jgi:hypothetical protein
MAVGVISGLLAAALAGVAEHLVFTGMETPPTPVARATRIIAAAFIGGILALGLVIAMLAGSIEGAEIPAPAAFGSAALMAVGAFGIALIFRQHASGPAYGELGRERSRAVFLMAAADGVAVLGAALAIVFLFVASA